MIKSIFPHTHYPYTRVAFWYMLLLVVGSIQLSAQVDFKINPHLNQNNIRSAVSPTSFADINGDGWDDLAYINNQGNLEVILFDKNGLSKKLKDTINNNNLCYTINVADINNDGINEIMTSGEYNGLNIFSLSPNQDSLILRQHHESQFFAQGSNFADINADGFIDLFICNDDGLSKIFINDTKGQFDDSSDLIDLKTKSISDNSGNYASEWTDYDLDGDLDLYIAKCRVGVDDPTDPRRINVLYENMGADGFMEVATERGLAVSEQSWTINFADFDNDGDMDAFIANHDAPHMLFENVGNKQYVQRPNTLGNLRSYALHSIVRDFDNNGYEDIFVTGDRSYFIFNQGDFNFEIVSNPIKGYNIAYFSTSDYDQDGFLDLYASYLLLKSDLPYFAETLWENKGNTNNWVGFHLIGNESNSNGIGATLELHGAWGKQTKQLKAGESYGLMNSLNINFGLGDAQHIDSLKIIWPQGKVDTHIGLAINEYYQASEGSCLTSALGFDPMQSILCKEDTITLGSTLFPFIFDWSNGAKANVLEVTKPDLIYARLKGQNGCTVVSNSVLFRDDTDVDDVSIRPLWSEQYCEGQTIDLSIINPNNEFTYQWSNGVEGSTNSVHQTGTYTVTASNQCTTSQDSISIIINEFETNSIINDTVALNEDALLISDIDGFSSWFEICPACDIPFFEGDSLTIQNVLESDSFLVVQDIDLNPTIFEIGPDSLSGTNPFRDTGLNGSLIFETHQAITLHSVDVLASVAGPRTIWLLDKERKIVAQKTLAIDTGLVTLNLDFKIPKGTNFQLSTNADSNLVYLGTISPKLGRSNDGIAYPYTLNQLLTIQNSNLGASFYPYFYNWQVSTPKNTCTVEGKAYIVLENPNSTQELEYKNISIAPNPSNGLINISSIQETIASISVLDHMGRIYLSKEISHKEEQLDLSILPKGIYYLHIYTTNSIKPLIRKIIIQ